MNRKESLKFLENCVNNYENLTREETRLLESEMLNCLLVKPYSIEEIKELSDENFISGVISIDITDIIYANDIEDFDDILSERLILSDLLIDISYKVIGAKAGNVIIFVSGDASALLSEDQRGE